MAGVIQGLSVGWHFTVFKGNTRSLISTRCDVKETVKSSTVGLGPNSPNQSCAVTHLVLHIVSYHEFYFVSYHEFYFVSYHEFYFVSYHEFYIVSYPLFFKFSMLIKRNNYLIIHRENVQ